MTEDPTKCEAAGSRAQIIGLARPPWRTPMTGDGVIRLDPPLARLVALLRETPGRPVPYERLIRRMWPEAPDYLPAHAQQHLRQLAHLARSAWEQETGEVGAIATVARHGYVWAGSDHAVDPRRYRYSKRL